MLLTSGVWVTGSLGANRPLLQVPVASPQLLRERPTVVVCCLSYNLFFLFTSLRLAEGLAPSESVDMPGTRAAPRPRGGASSHILGLLYYIGRGWSKL